MQLNASDQLKELAKQDPEKAFSLAMELIQAAQQATQEAPPEPVQPEEPETVEALFEGSNEERPTKSQTAKSAKYSIWADLVTEGDSDDDDEAPKALVNVYLPPEVAAETIEVTVVSVGPKAQIRQIKGNRKGRKAA